MPTKLPRSYLDQVRNDIAVARANGAGQGTSLPDPSFRPAEVGYLTVFEQVAYSAPGSAPFAVQFGWGRQSTSAEQPYARPNFRVGGEWKTLDLGWLADEAVGYVCLANEEGRYEAVNPTPLQLYQTLAKVVELGVLLPSGEVLPIALLHPRGQSLRYEPYDAKALRLRCRNGEARVSLTIFPR